MMAAAAVGAGLTSFRWAVNSVNVALILMMLVVAGLFVGTIASRCSSARHRETATRFAARRVHRVAEATANGSPTAAVPGIAQDEITALLDLASCRFQPMPYDHDEARPRLGRNGTVEAQTFFRFRPSRNGRVGFVLPSDGVELQVLARGQHIGRFVLVPSPGTATTVDERLMSIAIADQVGAAWPNPAGGSHFSEAKI